MHKFILFITLIFIAVSVMVQPACKGTKQEDKHTDSIIAPFVSDPQIKALTEKIHQSPNDGQLYAKRAQAFLDMKKVMPAYNDITKAIRLDPKNVSFYLLETDIFINGGSADSAIHSLQKIIALQPDNKDAYSRLAKVYFYEKDYDKSMAQVKHLIEMDPNNFEPYFIMGMNYKEAGDTAKAVKSFLESLQHKPDSYDAYMQLGLLTSKYNSTEAAQYFDNAIRIDSTKTDSWYAKAKFYQDHNQYEKAKATYRKLIGISPYYFDAFYNTGIIDLLQDSVAAAKKCFDYTIKVKPNSAKAYYYRGLCESQLGDKQQAKADLTQCLTLDPKNELAGSLLNTLNKN